MVFFRVYQIVILGYLMFKLSCLSDVLVSKFENLKESRKKIKYSNFFVRFHLEKRVTRNSIAKLGVIWDESFFTSRKMKNSKRNFPRSIEDAVLKFYSLTIFP